MKKKLFALAVIMVGCAGFAAGCLGSQKPEIEETTLGGDDAESSTITGVVEEMKDFMFIVTDENGTGYAFPFEEKPEGLEGVNVGDAVTVTYTGTISEVDPFEGEILSVEKE